MSRYAVIDVGTNSVKFHIGERGAGGAWRTVVDRAEVTRLGEGLDETDELGEKPMKRTIDAIAGMADEAESNEVVETAAVGTAGLRAAGNSAAFIAAVKDRCGVVVEVISGEEEARLAYLAAVSGLDLGQGPDDCAIPCRRHRRASVRRPRARFAGARRGRGFPHGRRG